MRDRQCPECGEVSAFKGRRCPQCWAELDAIRAPYVLALLEGTPQAELDHVPEMKGGLSKRDVQAAREAGWQGW